MDKSDLNIIISVFILALTAISVYLTYSSTSVEIDFFSSDESTDSGSSIKRKCAYNYKCQFVHDKEVVDNSYYNTITVYATAHGKRTNNLLIDFECANMDFYGVLVNSKVHSNIEIQQIYDFSKKLKISQVDAINFQGWDILYTANESVHKLSCSINYVSDEVASGNKKINVDHWPMGR